MMSSGITINVTAVTSRAQTNLTALANVLRSLQEDLNDFNDSLNGTNDGLEDTSNTARNETVSALKDLTKSLNTAQKAFKDFSSVANKVKTIFAGVLSAIGFSELTKGLEDAVSNSLDYASSLAESASLIDSVYNTSVEDVITWADTTAGYYGITSRASEKYISVLSAMLKNLGVSNEETVKKISLDYTKLAGDIASAFNTTTDEAFTAIKAAVSGETEPLMKYGLVLTEVNLNAYLLSKGITTSFSAFSEQNKQLVRYSYLLEHTGSIQGDYARTFSSFSNEVKTLKNSWEEFLTVLGQYAIPLIKPVVEWLMVALEYAKAVVKAVGDLLGIEAYTPSTIKNVKDDTSTILDNTINTADAQKDTTKAVENTNKALKAGVKLLDLYTLDFTSASSGASSSAGDIDSSLDTDLSSQLLSGLDYSEYEPLSLGIDIDQKAVDRVAKKIASFIEDLQDNYIVKLALDIIQDFAENPIEKTLDILIASVSLKNAFNLGKKVFSEIYNGFESDTKKNIDKIKSVASGIANVMLGVFEGFLGGLNFGQVIYQSLKGEEVNIIDLATGITTSISGIVTAAAGGFAIGGPAGAAVGAFTGLLGTLAGTIIGYGEEQQKYLTSLATGIATSGASFEELSGKFTSLFNSEEAKSALAPVLEQLDSVRTDSNIIVTETLPSLYNELSKNPEDETIANKISKTFAELKSNIVDAANSLNNVNLDNFGSILEGIRESLDLTSAEIRGIIENMKSFHNELEIELADTYERLSRQKSSGVLLSDEEISFLEKYEAAYMGVNGEADTFISKMDSIASKDFDLSTYTTAVKDLEDTFNTARDTINNSLDDINLKLSSPDLTADEKERLEAEQILVKKSFDNLVEAYNTNLELMKSKLKEKTLNIGVGVALEQRFDFEGAYNHLSTKLKEEITNLGSQYADEYKKGERNLSVPFNVVPEWFINTMPDVDITTEEGQAEVRAQYQAFIEDAFGLHNAFDFTVDGEVTLDLDYVQLENPYLYLLGDQIEKALYSSITSVAGFKGIEADGKKVISYTLPSRVDVDPDFNVTDEALESAKLLLSKPFEAAKTSTDVETAAIEAGASAAKSSINGLTSNITTEEASAKTKEALGDMLNGVSTPKEAEKKGSDIATTLVNSITSAINESTKSESAFMIAVDNMKTLLSGLGASLAEGIKAGVNSSAQYINKLSESISTNIAKMGITDDMTITALITSLKSNRVNIPMLANGAVIPPNNPFLAVLGDQRSGKNIEAPVSLIRETVREAAGSDNITVVANVYIGDEQIKDFVIDTVVDNNLKIG